MSKHKNGTHIISLQLMFIFQSTKMIFFINKTCDSSLCMPCTWRLLIVCSPSCKMSSEEENTQTEYVANLKVNERYQYLYIMKQFRPNILMSKAINGLSTHFQNASIYSASVFNVWVSLKFLRIE